MDLYNWRETPESSATLTFLKNVTRDTELEDKTKKECTSGKVLHCLYLSCLALGISLINNNIFFLPKLDSSLVQ